MGVLSTTSHTEPVDVGAIFDLSFFGFLGSRFPRCCLLAMAHTPSKAEMEIWRSQMAGKEGGKQKRPADTSTVGASLWSRTGLRLNYGCSA